MQGRVTVNQAEKASQPHSQGQGRVEKAQGMVDSQPAKEAHQRPRNTANMPTGMLFGKPIKT